MKFQFLVIFLLSVYVTSIYAENIESFEFSKSSEKVTDISSKIHPILVRWQASEDHDEFAKNNNLSYKEDKIKVYIYLESAELRSELPSDITIASFDEKIAVAFVTSEQLDKLDDLDFVERVMLPVLARTPPIPKVETPETQTQSEDQSDYLTWLVIGGIVLFTTVVILKRQRRQEK